MESSYRGKVPKLPMAKGKLTWRLSMAPKFPVVNAIEEIIVIIIIIIIIINIIIIITIPKGGDFELFIAQFAQ